MNPETIEYRIVPVTRFQVTRYHGGHGFGGVGQSGEYGNATTAYEVAYALCKAEHDRLGWPVGDERIVYPRHPDDPNTGPGVIGGPGSAALVGRAA